MKKLKDLSVNDAVYLLGGRNPNKFLSEKDYYGTEFNYSIISEYKIHNISINKEKDIIEINRSSGYNGSSFLFTFPCKNGNDSRHTIKNDTWFVDKSEYHQIIKEKVIAEINETNQGIKDAKTNGLKRIKRLRESYYDILN